MAHGIISSNVLKSVPAMLEASGYVTSHRRADMNILTEKRCWNCGEIKPITEFHKKASRCKKCACKVSKEWRESNPQRNNDAIKKWHKEHPERVAEIKTNWRKLNLEKQHASEKKYRDSNKEKEQKRTKKYYQEHREEKAEYQKEYRASNKEKVRLWDRLWSKANRDKMREKARVRRARKLSSLGRITAAEERALFTKYNNRCINPNCPDPTKPVTLDHIVPLSRGGADTIDNAQPLCLSCNDSKWVKTIDYRKHHATE